MSKGIIIPNKWSQEERLKVVEGIVIAFSKITDALGFNVVIQRKGVGHNQAGISKRREGFDLPTVIIETQGMEKVCNELLQKLGVKDEVKHG